MLRGEQMLRLGNEVGRADTSVSRILRTLVRSGGKIQDKWDTCPYRS